MQTKNLFAIYDLQVSPCSYDFFQFLVAAELHRKRYHFPGMELIFLPGPKNGYREDTIRTDEQNEMFFKNVIVPGLSVYSSIAGFQSYSRRSDFQLKRENLEDVFPRGYTVENPVSDYVFNGVTTAYLRQEQPVFFDAPHYAKANAKELLNYYSKGKKTIILTTRELARDDSGTRSIEQEVWKRFFHELDSSIYQPLIIRDTSKAFCADALFDGIPEISAASIHLPFRLALYQESDLNFFKNNGPAVFGYYSSANAVIFNEFDQNHVALAADWARTHYGMNEGSQQPLTPQNSIILWGKENTSRLKEMLDFDWEDKDKYLHPFKDVENLTLTLLTSINYLLRGLVYGILPEDIKTIQVANHHIAQHKFNWNIEDLIKSMEGKQIPLHTWANISRHL